MAHSLQPHGLCDPTHTRCPCPSLSPRVCSDSSPLSRWCHPNMSSSVAPFSSCPQSFLAKGSFPISQLFSSGGQSIGDSASASVLPVNIQDWFPLGSTGLISLQSKGLSRVFSSTITWKHQFFCAQPPLWSNSHIHTWLLEKPSVQLTQLCPTLCDPMDCSTAGFPLHHQLLKLAQTHVHRVGDASNHLILCHPLLPPSIFSSIRVFSNESVLHIRWPKYWSFSFSISPSNEYLGLISFRIDWFDLLAVQGTLKSLLQHRSSKASILWCSAFFIVQLSHLYMTTGKTIALTRWTFVGKVTSLLLNMLSRLVIAFLLRSKWL